MSLDRELSKTNFARLGLNSAPYNQIVIQVYVDDKPYLRTGPSNHAGELFKFLKEWTDVDTPLVSKEKLEEFRKGAPDSEGENYKVAGMGFAKVYTDSRRAVFDGESATYNIGIDKEHLEKLAEYIPDWKFEVKS